MTHGSLRAALLLALLAGCTPHEVRTPSTEGKGPEALALLRVPAHHDRLRGFWSPAHVRALVIDGVPYSLQRDATDVWLSPGEHEIHAMYGRCVYGPTDWTTSSVDDNSINCFHQPRFKAEAGRIYQLGCAVSWNSGPWVTLTFRQDP